MPLVRIDVQAGRSPEQVRRIADAVQEVMLAEFAAPPRDRYQIITEHPVGHIIAEDTGLGIERTDGVVVVQIFQQGRSQQQKVRRLRGARRAAGRVWRAAGPISSCRWSGTSREDWSFGHGRAQFLTGEL